MSVNSVNSYSAVLPPSPMVFFIFDLCRTQQHGGQWLGLALHLLGMSLGVSIMLLIALYEHQLKNVFGEDDHHH